MLPSLLPRSTTLINLTPPLSRPACFTPPCTHSVSLSFYFFFPLSSCPHMPPTANISLCGSRRRLLFASRHPSSFWHGRFPSSEWQTRWRANTRTEHTQVRMCTAENLNSCVDVGCHLLVESLSALNFFFFFARRRFTIKNLFLLFVVQAPNSSEQRWSLLSHPTSLETALNSENIWFIIREELKDLKKFGIVRYLNLRGQGES